MLLSTALCCFLIAWSSLFLTDYLLRLFNCTSYLVFASRYGLEISPFQLRMYTSRRDDDDTLLSSSGADPSAKGVYSHGGSLHRSLTRVWFCVGTGVALTCLVGISFYLTKMLVNDFVFISSHRPKVVPYRTMPPPTISPISELPPDGLPPAPMPDYDVLDTGTRSDSGLVPIIPGVNLPWTHIPLFMGVLLVAAFFHECGHSWAAHCEDVRVNGFGFFVLALYPGAFTDIEPESLKRTTAKARLMIFCGGIWHNVVLAIFAYLLYLSTPALLIPLYEHGNGVTVTGVDGRSGLHGPAGLAPGYVVEAIEDCPVKELQSWRNCVRRLELERHGRCVAKSRVEAARAEKGILSETLDELHCCEDFSNITHAHMCFETSVLVVTEVNSTKAPSLDRVLRLGIVEQTAGEVVHQSVEISQQLSCLSARFVTDQPICNKSNTCEQMDVTDPRVCIYPALYNGTQLARLTVRGLNRPVLFVGNLDEIISMVWIEGWVTRFDFVPWWCADAALLLPKYLFTLSLALAVLNAVPCYFLDGEHIVQTLVTCLCRTWTKRRRHQVTTGVLTCGSALLGANIVLGFVKMLF